MGAINVPISGASYRKMLITFKKDKELSSEQKK